MQITISLSESVHASLVDRVGKGHVSGWIASKIIDAENDDALAAIAKRAGVDFRYAAFFRDQAVDVRKERGGEAPGDLLAWIASLLEVQHQVANRVRMGEAAEDLLKVGASLFDRVPEYLRAVVTRNGGKGA